MYIDRALEPIVRRYSEHFKVVVTVKKVSESLAGRAGIIEMLGLSNAEIAGRTSMPFDPSPEYFTGRVADMPSYDVREAYRRIAAESLPAIRALPDDLRAATIRTSTPT